jgi:hypothetical protein
MRHQAISYLLLNSLLILLLSSLCSSAITCRPAELGVELYLDHAPANAVSGQEFPVFLTLTNNENITQAVTLYSYVYRGSKAYSKARKLNLQNLTLGPGKELSLEIPNNATASPGAYKLKILLEYTSNKTNKTREITLPINLTKSSLATENLGITYLRLDTSGPPRIIALINNSRDEGYDLRLLLESGTELSERELSIAPRAEARLEFPLKTPSYDNYLFLKLYHNETLIDISGLTLKNTTLAPKPAKPFNLVQGDIILNATTEIYTSSSQKSQEMAIPLLLAASITLNLYLLFRKQPT